MIKRTIGILLLIFISIFAFSQKKVKIDLNSSKQTLRNKEVVQNISNGIIISETISSIEFVEKETKEGTFVELYSDRMTKSFDKGKPNLPLISRLIDIPLNKKPIVKILTYDEEIIKLGDYQLFKEIIPAQPSLSKSDNPKDVPFYKNIEIYGKNEFFKNEIIKFEDRGFLRNKHIGYIEISPFEYNPVENTLKVLNNIKVEVSFVDDVSSKTINIKSLISPYFQNIALNTLNKSTESKALISNPVKYVIVSDRMFEETLQPFIEWKTMKGFNVIEAYTDESNVGNTTTSIKAYLQDLYENPSDDVSPTFVLFVGDIEQIPSFDTQLSGDYHVTDLYYCEYTGDRLPDVFYGRFSAETIEELQPQIDKTLELEKYEMPDPSYLDNVVLVAGVDGTYAPTYGNGAINYANDYYTNSDNGVNSYYYLYNDESGVMSSNNSGASASIRSYISSGVSFTNYTAHCGSDGWSDPSFNIGHIDGLTNEHMYPLIIGNCCQSVKFEGNSFGEEILRAVGKGAVGYIGGSDFTYWDEDYYWGVGLTSTITVNPTYENSELGVYDRFFHLNGENKQDWYITQGQIIVAGNLAVEASSSSRKAYYWEIYHLMGDPSLTPYVTVPEVLIASYDSEIIKGSSTFVVTTEADAYVAISKEGVLLDAKLADETGLVNLNFESLDILGTLDLVITKQNRQPKIDEIIIMPATSPYVVLDYSVIDDALENNNSEIDFGETIKLDIQLKNLSESYDAYNVIANLSSVDTNVVISDISETYGTILKSDSAFTEASFVISFKNRFTDQQKVRFNLEILAKDVSDVDYSWNSTISYLVNAPVLEIGELFIDDSFGNNNKILDPEETADVSLIVSNNGSASISNLKGIISIIEGEAHLTINNIETEAFTLNTNSTDTLIFNVTADTETLLGTSVFVLFEINDQTHNYYSNLESKEIIIGEIPEIKITDNDTLVSSLVYFYDSGGSNGNYTNNENDTITFYPANTRGKLKVDFNSFNVEPNGSNCYDYIEVYDSDTIGPTLIGSYCGSDLPTTILATNEKGALTFRFDSDESITKSGWEAKISNTGYFVKFMVKDSETALEDAAVEFNNEEKLTNSDGEVRFNYVTGGEKLSYVVRKTGYDTFEGSVDVDGDKDISVTMTTGIVSFEVEFTVSNESKPIDNAQVILEADTLYTNTDGIVKFRSVLEANNIPYKISKIHFEDSEGFVDVQGENVSLEKSLNYKSYKITFNINDGKDPVEGATISLDGKSEITNSTGEYIFDIIYSLDQAYQISKNGYVSVNDMINIDTDTTIEKTLSLLTYNVTFEAVDDASHFIENATVIFNGATQYTNANGRTVFNSVEADESLIFTISKDGYWHYDSTLNVVNADVLFKARLSSATGIVSVNELDIRIYPNPSTGVFNLEILNTIKGTYTVKIFDVIGSVVYSNSIKVDQNVMERIDISGKAKGIYFLSVESDSGSILTKRIITR